MRDLDQIEPPEETGQRRTRKRNSTVGMTAPMLAAERYPDPEPTPTSLKPAREFLCFPHEGRRIAIAIDSLHLLGSTANGSRVEMLFGSSSLDGFVIGADTIANASIMTTINAIGYVTGTLKIRDKGASPEALARECAAAVAGRKLGDMPQVSRKGMALGSILPNASNVPHHPPADPTDCTTLTGEEREHLRAACGDLGGES